MIAPDYETIFDLESAAEAGVVSILQMKGIDCARSMGVGTLTAPYASIRYINGPVTGHMGTTKGGKTVYDAWNGTLIIVVITNRTGDPTLHSSMLSKVRLAMQGFRGEFTVERFPHHSLREVREAGTQLDIVTRDTLDMTGLSFSVLMSVRADAWPIEG